MQKTLIIILSCCIIQQVCAQGGAVQRLESVITSEGAYLGKESVVDKRVFTYNTSGNLIKETISINNGYGGWMPMTQYEYEYNTYGQNTRMTISSWDNGVKAWIYAENSVKSYHPSGALDTEISYYWGIDSLGLLDWRTSGKSVTAYKNGEISSITGYFWDDNLKVWTNSYRSEFVYNIFSYSLIGKLWSGNNWSNGNKTDYIVNTYGSLLSYTEYNSRLDSPQWRISKKAEYTYNKNHDETSQSKYDWNGIEWHMTHKDTSSYDEKYRFVGQESFILKNGQYVTNTKYEWQYADEDPTLIIPYHMTEDPDQARVFKHKVVKEIKYDYYDNNYVYVRIKRYTYSPVIVTDEKENFIAQDRMVLYPNPAENMIKVVWGADASATDRLEIYNHMGILVKQLYYLGTNQEVSIAELPAGIYTYKLEDNKHHVQGTLLKY